MWKEFKSTPCYLSWLEPTTPDDFCTNMFVWENFECRCCTAAGACLSACHCLPSSKPNGTYVADVTVVAMVSGGVMYELLEVTCSQICVSLAYFHLCSKWAQKFVTGDVRNLVISAIILPSNTSQCCTTWNSAQKRMVCRKLIKKTNTVTFCACFLHKWGAPYEIYLPAVRVSDCC